MHLYLNYDTNKLITKQKQEAVKKFIKSLRYSTYDTVTLIENNHYSFCTGRGIEQHILIFDSITSYFEWSSANVGKEKKSKFIWGYYVVLLK